MLSTLQNEPQQFHGSRVKPEHSLTCRKAAKALLVLIPLLGVTYILVIWTPSHKTARVVFTYLQITLLSTQGFTVAVLYCFMNGEVSNLASALNATLFFNAHTLKKARAAVVKLPAIVVCSCSVSNGAYSRSRQSYRGRQMTRVPVFSGVGTQKKLKATEDSKRFVREFSFV